MQQQSNMRDDMIVQSGDVDETYSRSLLESVIRPLIRVPCGEVTRQYEDEGKLMVTAADGSLSAVEGDGSALTAGGVRYVSSKVLAKLLTLRGRAHEVLVRLGTRFLDSAYMVPRQNLDKVRVTLAEIAAEFREYKASLLSLHPESGGSVIAYHMDLWEREHPEIRPWKAFFPKPEAVVNGASCQFSYFAIQPMTMEGVEDGLAESLRGIPMQLLSEVAQDVRNSFLRQAYKRMESGAVGTATSRAIGVLRRVQVKLASMAMVSTEIAMASAFVEDCIQRLPEGSLKGRDYDDLVGVMSIIADPAMFIDAAVNHKPAVDLSWNMDMQTTETPQEATQATSQPTSHAEQAEQPAAPTETAQASAETQGVTQAESPAESGDEDPATQDDMQADGLTGFSPEAAAVIDRIVSQTTESMTSGTAVSTLRKAESIVHSLDFEAMGW